MEGLETANTICHLEGDWVSTRWHDLALKNPAQVHTLRHLNVLCSSRLPKGFFFPVFLLLSLNLLWRIFFGFGLYSPCLTQLKGVLVKE